MAEVLFRGLAHGLLSQSARTQRDDTSWFVSWPNIGCALMYAGFIWLLWSKMGPQGAPVSSWQMTLSLVSATVFGVTLGMVRERSQSIFPAIGFHIVSVGFALVVGRFL